MFVCKQNYYNMAPMVVTAAWATPAGASVKQSKQPKKEFDGSSANLTKLETSFTERGFQCAKFEVYKQSVGNNANPVKKTVNLRYDFQSGKIEVTIIGQGRIELKKAYIMPNTEGLRVHAILKEHEWFLEFPSMYKTYQFMQLVQLFQAM